MYSKNVNQSPGYCRCGDAAVLVQNLLLVLPGLREIDTILRQYWANIQKVSPSLRETDTILRQYWANIQKVSPPPQCLVHLRKLSTYLNLGD